MKLLLRPFFIILLCYSTQTFAQDSLWLFSYFKNNGEDGLHLAYSEDALHWQALRGDSSVLTPTAGFDKLMRDPCITRGGDGKFHMIWTSSWKEKGIGYASSNDLIHWSPQQYLLVMNHETEAKNCWAPEVFYDKASSQYMIYWATTITGRFPATDTLGDHNHRMYYVTTKDFKTFSKTKLLYDQGFNVIDASIYKINNKYLMFLKDETLKPKAEKNIRIAVSEKLINGYGKPSPPITGNYWAEGPTLLEDKGVYILYFDKYVEHQYGAIRSTNLKDWTDISDQIKVPQGLRHGTIIKISRGEFDRLEKGLKML
jgi:predicted GH43/DUF377 family glycosyl hydrolase